MITHKDLLNRFSKLLGTPESERRLSFEIFTKKISQKLSLGDEIKIDRLGFFSYKLIRTANSEKNEYCKVIIFSEEKISSQNRKFLLFFLQDEHHNDVIEIDSYLNLSVGNPLITSGMIADLDFLSVSSFNEMIGLVESKVEKLIDEGEIFQHHDLSDEEFIFTPDEDIVFDTSDQNLISSQTKTEEVQDVLDSTIVHEEKDVKKIFDDFELVEPEKIESVPEEIIEDKYDEVKWNFDEQNLTESITDFEQEESELTSEGFSEVRDPFMKSILESEKSDASVLSQPDNADKEYKSEKKLSGKLIFFMVVFFVVLASGIGIYLNYDKIKDYLFGEEAQPYAHEFTKIQPIIITGTFEFPINYPSYYPDNSVPAQDSLIISASAFLENLNPAKHISIKDETSSISETPKTINMVKVRGNIYQRNLEYLVQISSWKSKLKAEEELKKYTDKNFSAELVEDSSSKIGKFYRIMIGGFDSYDEARKFINKNY